jgi:hypothetical protein
MTNLSEFVKYVAPDVVGCPDVIMERAVIQTCRDFCDKTWILSKVLTIPIVSTDIDTYQNNSVELELNEALDTNTKAIAFKSFFVNKQSVILSYVDAVEDSDLFKNRTDQKFFTFTRDNLALVYPFSGACTVDCEVISMPTMDATTLSDVLFDRCIEGITAGTLARLFRQPNKSWTSLELVPYMDRTYRNAVIETKRRLNKSNTRGSLIVQPRSFGEITYYNDNSIGYVLE